MVHFSTFYSVTTSGLISTEEESSQAHVHILTKMTELNFKCFKEKPLDLDEDCFCILSDCFKFGQCNCLRPRGFASSGHFRYYKLGIALLYCIWIDLYMREFSVSFFSVLSVDSAIEEDLS